MNWTALSRGSHRRGAGVAAAALSGCSSDGKGTPAWTAAAAARLERRRRTRVPRRLTGAAADAPLRRVGGPGSTASAWKVFTDPAKERQFRAHAGMDSQFRGAGFRTMPGRSRSRSRTQGRYLARCRPAPAATRAGLRRRSAGRTSSSSSVPVELSAWRRRRDHHPMWCSGDPGYKYFVPTASPTLWAAPEGTACALQNWSAGREARATTHSGRDGAEVARP